MENHTKKCRVCEKPYSSETYQEGDVWVLDGKDLICGECYIRVMNKLCDYMEQQETQRINAN